MTYHSISSKQLDDVRFTFCFQVTEDITIPSSFEHWKIVCTHNAMFPEQSMMCIIVNLYIERWMNCTIRMMFKLLMRVSPAQVIYLGPSDDMKYASRFSSLGRCAMTCPSEHHSMINPA